MRDNRNSLEVAIIGVGTMRRDIEDPTCQKECGDCPLKGVTPDDCAGNCRKCPYSRFCPCGNRFIYPQLVGLAQVKTRDVTDVPIASVRDDPLPPPPLVRYDEAMIRILGRILRVKGQPRPVIVRPRNGLQKQGYHLVGNVDIFLAEKALRLDHVLVQIEELTDYEARVRFCRYELLRLDLSWENQARYLLALQEVYREWHCFVPSVATLASLSDLTRSRTRDLLHGITLLNRHNLEDGMIPFPTLLRSVRDAYPEAIQRELIRGLIKGNWTRRRANGYAAAALSDLTLHIANIGRTEINVASLADVPPTRGNGRVLPPVKSEALIAVAGVGGR